MKTIIFLISISFLNLIHNELSAQNLPTINTSSKSFFLEMSQGDDTPLIFGYESPDAGSKKLICFSSFTKDVENNPHRCAYGAYYDTSELDIQYAGSSGNFVKLKMNRSGSEVYFYMEKKNINFE